MTDSIDESDVRRADKNVDPTALSSGDIEDQLPDDDFSSEAQEEFARQVSEARKSVSQQAQSVLAENISEPGANDQRQLYGQDVEENRTTFVGTAKNVKPEVGDDGTVYGVNVNTGTRAEIGSVNLDRGAPSGGREDGW